MPHVMKPIVLYEEERRCPLKAKGYPKIRMRYQKRGVEIRSKSKEEGSDDGRCCKKWDLDEHKRVLALKEKPLYEILEPHVRLHKERRESGRQAKKTLL